MSSAETFEFVPDSLSLRNDIFAVPLKFLIVDKPFFDLCFDVALQLLNDSQLEILPDRYDRCCARTLSGYDTFLVRYRQAS